MDPITEVIDRALDRAMEREIRRLAATRPCPRCRAPLSAGGSLDGRIHDHCRGRARRGMDEPSSRMAWNSPARRPMYSDRRIEIIWNDDVAWRGGRIEPATYEFGEYDEPWEGWRDANGKALWPNFRWRYATL